MECGKNPEEGKIHENGSNFGRFRTIRDARGLLAVREQVEKQAMSRFTAKAVVR